MDSGEEPEPIFDDVDRSNPQPHWPRRNATDEDEVRGLPDGWVLEAERFEGAWFYEEACARGDDDAMASCVARILFHAVAINAVRRHARGEDISDAIAVAHGYLGPLDLAHAERTLFARLAHALNPFDPAAVTDALLGLAWRALAEDMYSSARNFAELAYETGISYGEDECAEAAARAVARLAILSECPRTARRYRGRAAVLRRRGLAKRL